MSNQDYGGGGDGQGGGWLKRNQTMVFMVVLGLGVAGFVVVPKIIRPSINVPIPQSTPDLQKTLQGILTPSNMQVVSSLATQVLANVAKGQQTTVIISNQLPPPPVPGLAPPNQPPPSIGGAVIPGPGPNPGSPGPGLPSPSAGRPTLDLFIMTKNGALPAATDAPVARLADSTELFRAARFKEDSRYTSHQDRNLWLKWQGRISVPSSGTHTFFHAINMNRVLPPGGNLRATDYGGRGKQTVYTHLYVDGQKLDSKEKRFSAIQGSERTQLDTTLSAGYHDVELWIGIAADGAKNLYDETSMSLEVRYAGQSLPVKLAARDLAW